VPIPEELRESLAEVHAFLEEAERDPDVRLDHGDAIQVGAVCGGRIGRMPRPYVLTYFPERDTRRGRWFLTLHRTEIEDIADGVMTEVAMHCCVSPECRCKFQDPDGNCFFRDYADDPDYGTFAFPEAAAKLERWNVAGIADGATRNDVTTLLGPPDKSGGGETLPAPGYVRPWVEYHRSDCQLRFEFDERGAVLKVTVLDRDREPGK
jgi:hypothetical protein